MISLDESYLNSTYLDFKYLLINICTDVYDKNRDELKHQISELNTELKLLIRKSLWKDHIYPASQTNRQTALQTEIYFLKLCSKVLKTVHDPLNTL